MHPILANAGLPIFVILSPVTLLTLPLIIWVEFAYYRRVAPKSTNWISVTVANCITTIIGAPLLAIAFSCVAPATSRWEWNEAGGIRRFIVRVFTDGFWALPGKISMPAAITGIALYLLAAFFVSVAIERWYLRKFITVPEEQKLRFRQVCISHLISYPVMILFSTAILIGWGYTEK